MVSARVFPWAKGLSETLFILLTLHDCCYSHIIAEDSKTQNVNKIKHKANHGGSQDTCQAARRMKRRGGGAAEVSTCSAGPHVLYFKPWMPWIGVVFHSVGRGVIRLTDLYSVLLLPASNFIQNWASASLISCPHQDHWVRFGQDHFSVSLLFWFAGWQVHTCSTLEVFCSWGRRWSQLSCHSLVTHLFFSVCLQGFLPGTWCKETTWRMFTGMFVY